jgi:uncharacterized membrane protein YjdF
VNTHKWIAWIATSVFILFSIIGTGPSTYRFGALFLGPLVWVIYFCRHLLHIAPSHFALLACAMILHNLGAFDAYRQVFAGLDFDTYVHFVFGVAGGFIVARALACNLGFSGWKLWTGTVLLILGIGAMHELIEFVSTLILGPEKGMLKIDSPDRFDTHKDLGNNLLGTLLALGFSSVKFGSGLSRKMDGNSV